MKTNLMKSILHLKEDTEYQIPLMEKDNKEIGRAKVGGTSATTQAHKDSTAKANPAVETKKETEVQQNLETSKEEATVAQSQDEQKSKTDQLEATKEAKKKTGEISQEEVDDTDSYALENLKEEPEETQNQEQSNTEENNNNTTTETAPQVDSAKAALDEMKKLASQEGVVHPSLFISNFSKILGLMERAMQLQVKESGSVTKEEAPKATEQIETLEKTEVPEQPETPAKDK